jgi:flagellin-like protein
MRARIPHRHTYDSNRAVSPVIGVVVMVAIVVVIAAVIGGFVLGFGDQTEGSPPDARLACTDGGIEHVAGDPVPAETVEGIDASQVDGEALSAGETVNAQQLVWKEGDTGSVLVECEGSGSGGGSITLNAKVGLFDPPYTVPVDIKTEPMTVEVRDQNGNPFDPAGGIDIETTQNPGNRFSILRNGADEGDAVTGVPTNNGKFADTIEVDPGSGDLDRGEEYRLKLTAEDADRNQITEVIEATVTEYEVQAFSLLGATDNSGTSGDDSVEFDAKIKNHNGGTEETTVEVFLFENPSGPPDFDAADASAQTTVQIDKGKAKAITQADFPGLITDDQTIDDDDNGYVLALQVSGSPNLEFKFCSFDTSVSAPTC